MSDRKMMWVLGSTKPESVLGQAWWIERGSWPRPMAGRMRWYAPKLFDTKHEAEDWLFQKHIRKGRDVSFCKPMRVSIGTLKKIYGVN